MDPYQIHSFSDPQLSGGQGSSIGMGFNENAGQMGLSPHRNPSYNGRDSSPTRMHSHRYQLQGQGYPVVGQGNRLVGQGYEPIDGYGVIDQGQSWLGMSGFQELASDVTADGPISDQQPNDFAVNMGGPMQVVTSPMGVMVVPDVVNSTQYFPPASQMTPYNHTQDSMMMGHDRGFPHPIQQASAPQFVPQGHDPALQPGGLHPHYPNQVPVPVQQIPGQMPVTAQQMSCSGAVPHLRHMQPVISSYQLRPHPYNFNVQAVGQGGLSSCEGDTVAVGHINQRGRSRSPQERSPSKQQQRPMNAVPVQQVTGLQGQTPGFQPGGIQAQLLQNIQAPTPEASYPASSTGARSRHPLQGDGVRQATAVNARVRSVYPRGYPSSQKSTPTPLCGTKPSEKLGPVPILTLSNGSEQTVHNSTHSSSSADHLSSVDTGFTSLRLTPSTESQQGSDTTDPASSTKVSAFLDVRLSSEDGTGSHAIRDVVTQSVRRTYSKLGHKTYRVPQKAPISQHHPDKALVRTREGEHRVGVALEQLSIHLEEPMFILGDYHFESFLHQLTPEKVHPEDVPCVTEKLKKLNKERTFGDFDFLLFHRQLGLMVVITCAVTSNTDILHILKRVQKAYVHLNKSAALVQKFVAVLGIECPVTKIFSTPNLKRAFLKKVIGRDRQTEKALAATIVMCSNELPSQFRTQWSSLRLFNIFQEWWGKVKAKTVHATGQLSQEQLTLLVGCFLCPLLSKVDFDQSSPMAPSEKQLLIEEDVDEDSPSESGQDKDSSESSQTEFSVSDLNLSISNVTRPFSKYMEEYVKLYYPSFLTQTYRVPPIHFNIQKIEKKGDYTVLDMPMSKDFRADEGENRVVSAIEILAMKYEVVRPAFILCDFQYNNYLNKLKDRMFVKGDDRRPKRAFGQSVRAQHDCLLIHRRYGIIIVSVKSVGDNFGEWAQSGTDQCLAIKHTVEKALKQLPREEIMVKMVLEDVVHDLPCIKLIALPNVYRADAKSAISSDEAIMQEIDKMYPGIGIDAFLCKDELCEPGQSIWDIVEERADFYDNMCKWWDKAVGKGRENVLSEYLYMQIIGRFCGLLSTVEVWSSQTPRVEVRNQAEAVYETAERFSQVLLTPEQMEVLTSEKEHLFIHGPPGTGKTLLLVLRAQRWALQTGPVVILNLHEGSKGIPLGHHMEKQINQMLSKSSSAQTQDSKEGGQGQSTKHHHHLSNTHPSPSSTKSASVSTSQTTHSVLRYDLDCLHFNPEQPGKLADIPPGALVLVDEMNLLYHHVLDWIMRERQPGAVWCAGLIEERCPPGFETRALSRVLRCPPMVQRVLKHASRELGSMGNEMLEKHISEYVPSSAPSGLSTDGFRPLFIFHGRHNAFSDRLPHDCPKCGEELVHLLDRQLHLKGNFYELAKRRKLGPLPMHTESLSLKDVVIICRQVEPCPFITTLKAKGFPVKIAAETGNPMVVSVQESIMFTTPFAMTGLERKVVVYMPFEVQQSEDSPERRDEKESSDHWEEKEQGAKLDEKQLVNETGDIREMAEIENEMPSPSREEKRQLSGREENKQSPRRDENQQLPEVTGHSSERTDEQLLGMVNDEQSSHRADDKQSLKAADEEQLPERKDDTQSAEKGGRSHRVGTGHLDELFISQAIQQMSAEDQVSLWYSVSRCMGQLIIIVP